MVFALSRFACVRKNPLSDPLLQHRIADRYGLVHIEVQTCVVEAMSRGTELGLQARQQLLGGGAVTPELGRTILLAKLASAEVQFRGYVLDGFPASPEDLAALKVQPTHTVFAVVCLRVASLHPECF